MIGRHVLVVALALPSLATAGGQAPPPTADPPGGARQFSLQFAVPASPAFKLVEIEQSTILRPTSFQQLAATFGDFAASGGEVHLPREFGIELAPFFLARARTLTLSEYRRKAGLYRLRVSGAIKRLDDAAGATNIALGLRLAPRDATDPRTAPEVVGRITGITDSITAICTREAGRFRPMGQPRVVTTCADPRDRERALAEALATMTSADTAFARRTAELAGFRAHKALVQAEIDGLHAEIEELRDSWADSAWNKAGLEMAVAYSARTLDSVGRNPRFNAAAAWVSLAEPVSTWGQFVFGVTGRIGRDSVTDDNAVGLGLGTALYVGANRYKGFIEAQGSVTEDESAVGIANAGAEIFLGPGLWARATAAWEQIPGESRGRLVTRFNIATKFPFTTPTIPLSGFTTPR